MTIDEVCVRLKATRAQLLRLKKAGVLMPEDRGQYRVDDVSRFAKPRRGALAGAEDDPRGADLAG